MEPLNPNEFVLDIIDLSVDQLQLAYIGLAYHRGEVTVKMTVIKELMRAKRLGALMNDAHNRSEAL